MSLCSLKEKRTLTSVSEGKVGENKMHAPNRITVKIIQTISNLMAQYYYQLGTQIVKLIN